MRILNISIILLHTAVHNSQYIVVSNFLIASVLIPQISKDFPVDLYLHLPPSGHYSFVVITIDIFTFSIYANHYFSLI
ncbi:hypothetical protein BDB01DRAFT_811441 [Pilobolus umbonatus]|nr:hypothetical protein BDB01DRAFT_811441 [Pilobolus umbonatus]